MHSNALQSIEKHIATALKTLSVKHGRPLFEYDCVEKMMCLSQEIAKHKQAWLTEINCHLIFLDHVQSYLKKAFTDSEKISGRLTNLLDGSKMSELKEIILEFIKSVPRNYDIYFPLPALKKSDAANVQLSTSLSIRKFSELAPPPGGKPDELSVALGGGEKFNTNTTYIVMRSSGYIGYSITDIAFAQSLSSLKHFLHMSRISNLIKLRKSASLLSALERRGGYQPTIKALIVDLANQDEVASSINLPFTMGSYIRKIVLDREDAEISKVFRDNLKAILKLIELRNDNMQFIKSAIEWAFDSEIEENETISFIQLSIGLEAILGEEIVQESITETLADRCAYLLANNINERKKIRKDFREFYKFRSKLIHGRSMRLNDKERGFLYWGKHTLNKVILKELRHLNLSDFSK